MTRLLFVLCLVLCTLIAQAQNPTGYTAEQSGTASPSFNLKNSVGFWHISGPRSYEPNNPLSIFWNNGAYNRYFSVLDNGRVGIGTSSPKNIFEIAGAYSFHSGGHKVLGFGYAAGGSGTSLLSGYVAEIRLDPLNGLFRLGVSTQSYTTGQTSVTVPGALMINPQGKVGIGTGDFSGNHKLRVEGSVGAREVKVQASGWSDFVFQKDYALPSLTDVERFIAENKHLPAIPSEEEVMKEGINLGEMDAKLLQKIEELTLYMIDLNKRVDQLEQDNARLKEENQSLKNKK